MEETWDQIGKRLREAREKADISVDDVVFRARIPRTVVEALEAEDFSVFTSPTYAKSFLKQYSEFLQVDADPWLNALEPASYVSGESLQPMFGGEEAPVFSRRSARDGRKPEKEEKVEVANKWSAFWLLLMTAAVVLAAMAVFRMMDDQFGSGEKQSPAAAVQPPVEKKEAAPVAVDSEAPLNPEQAKKEEHPSTPPRAIIVRD